MHHINLIDIEASGLGLDSYPIEIAIQVNGTLRSWLIAPEPSWQHWDVHAQSLHGLSREIVLRDGQPARRVAAAINAVMTDSDGLLYSDAAYWDQDWIDTLFHSVALTPAFQILPISDLFPESEWPRFIDLRRRLAQSGRYRTHRAEQDILILHAALTGMNDLYDDGLPTDL